MAIARKPIKKKIVLEDPRFAVPPTLAGMTIGEFVRINVPSLRPTALLVRPHDETVPQRFVSEMPLPEFLRHCRSWQIARQQAGSIIAQNISEALARFDIVWG